MTRRNWIWTATLAMLGLSLAVNFFLVGYAMHGLRQGGAARVLISELAASYSPQVRTEFRSILRDNRARTFQALRQLRTARADLAAAQKATPFDEAAVRDAMTAVRSATTGLQATMQDYLLTALKTVNARSARGG